MSGFHNLVTKRYAISCLRSKLTAIASYEENISSKAWSYNPQLVGFFIASSQKTYYGGLGLLYHVVDSLVYPVLGVAWNTQSRKGFSLSLRLPETMLRYGLNEQLAVKLDFEIDVRIYHLATDSSIVSGGYFRAENMTPGFTLEY